MNLNIDYEKLIISHGIAKADNIKELLNKIQKTIDDNKYNRMAHIELYCKLTLYILLG